MGLFANKTIKKVGEDIIVIDSKLTAKEPLIGVVNHKLTVNGEVVDEIKAHGNVKLVSPKNPEIVAEIEQNLFGTKHTLYIDGRKV